MANKREQARAARRVDRAVQRAVVQGRRRLFESLTRYDSELTRRVERMTARVQREVRAMAGLRRAERDRRIARLVRQRLDRLMRDEERAIASATIEAARRGVEAGTVTATQAQTLATFVAGDAAPALVVETAEAVRAASYVRGLVNPQLSRVLRRNARETARRMGLQLQQSMHQGESVIAAAERLLAVEDPIVHLPAYLSDLREAVRIGHPGAIRTAGRAAVRSVNRLGLRDPRAATTLRNSAAQAVRAASSGRLEDIDRQIEHYVRDSARYQARRVARTEMSRAYSQAYTDSASASPSVKGMRWNLSTSHPQPDICDMYASVDAFGLGGGVYPTDDLQQVPAHPHCLCFYTAVMRTPEEIASGQDAPRGRGETYDQWMRSQPASSQDSILGRGRARAFRRGGRQGSRVISSNGQFRPLYEIQGRPAPQRSRGTRVDVRREHGGILPPRADGT